MGIRRSTDPAGVTISTFPTKRQLSARIADDVEKFLQEGQIEQIGIGVSGPNQPYSLRTAIQKDVNQDHAKNQAKKTT